MKKLLAALCGASLVLAPAALAQSSPSQFTIVPSCNSTQLYTAQQRGQSGPAAVDYFGNLCASGTGGGGGGGGSAADQTGANNADGVASTSTGQQHSVVWNYGYNGTSWDRARLGTGGAWLTIISGSLPAGNAILGKVTIDPTTHGTTDKVAADAYVNGSPNSSSNPLFALVTQSGSPWSFNLTQWAGTALGAPSSYGTAPTGIVLGVNAYVTDFPTGFNALQAGTPNTSGNPFFTQVTNPYSTTSTGALKPPTAGAGKIIEAICAVPATTSFTLTTNCQIVGASAGTYVTSANWANAILAELQQPPTGTVNIIGISGAAAVLTSAAAASKQIPATNSALYTFGVTPTIPPTVYSGAAQNLNLTITLQ